MPASSGVFLSSGAQRCASDVNKTWGTGAGVKGERRIEDPGQRKAKSAGVAARFIKIAYLFQALAKSAAPSLGPNVGIFSGSWCSWGCLGTGLGLAKKCVLLVATSSVSPLAVEELGLACWLR